ncbi:MAG: hypothetical protein KIT25_17095 [Enhydrobacter sp.]|nr:MAG: hypothetical protein KIT25_17095 [Enhydrobacter sp.]
MIRALRRRLDRLELAREPGLGTGDYLAEVLEEFAATADPEACARVRELIDRVAAERGDGEIDPQTTAVTPATVPEPPAAQPAPPPAPAAAPARTPREPPLMILDPSDPRNDWMLVINKPPNGPRPPPPPPYRDDPDDDDPLARFERSGW